MTSMNVHRIATVKVERDTYGSSKWLSFSFLDADGNEVLSVSAHPDRDLKIEYPALDAATVPVEQAETVSA